MSTQAPANWISSEIGTLARIVSGGTPPSKDPGNFTRPGTGIPWLTPADLSGYRDQYISHGARDLTDNGFAACSATRMPAGTVLFSSRAPIGYVAITTQELTTNQGFKSFVFPTNIDPRFAYYQLRHLKPVAEAMATGTTFKELSGAAAAKLPFLVAPTNEQKRIADKLDTVLARVDACRDRLARVAPLLKRFRQSVLAAATSGQLTEDWRNEGNGVAGSQWKKTTIGAITQDLRYGTSKKCDYKSTGIGVLRIPNIANQGKLDTSDLKRADFEASELQKLSLKAGDLLIIRSNGSVDLVGKTSLVSPLEEGLLFAGYLMRLRVDTTQVLPEFALLTLSAPIQRQRIELTAKSTSGVNNINAEELRALPLQFPKLQEQAEIVRRVETLFAFADRLEARLKTAQAATERLTPALLAKAFRGELVPQDPADEPAAELLKRLAEQRSSLPPSRTRNRKPAGITA